MKSTDYFAFIDNPSLKKHLNNAMDLITELTILTENKEYDGKKTLLSSFRKTILIHTGALVEALLLWKLKKIEKNKEIVLGNKWSYANDHLIHRIAEDKEVVWAHRKPIKKKIDDLDFNRITQQCVKHKLLRGDKLIQDVNKIRQLRNSLHIANIGDIEENYQPSDIQFGFSVLERVSKQLDHK